MSKTYTQFNLSIPVETKAALKQLCKESGVSLSQAIQDFVAASQKHGRLITTDYDVPPYIITMVRDELRRALKEHNENH